MQEYIHNALLGDLDLTQRRPEFDPRAQPESDQFQQLTRAAWGRLQGELRAGVQLLQFLDAAGWREGQGSL